MRQVHLLKNHSDVFELLIGEYTQYDIADDDMKLKLSMWAFTITGNIMECLKPGYTEPNTGIMVNNVGFKTILLTIP
jgi:hypothetical protein